jgi:hypothetical protein
MEAHKKLRESPGTRVPYGQAAIFYINATRTELEEQQQIRAELEKAKSQLTALTLSMQSKICDNK